MQYQNSAPMSTGNQWVYFNLTIVNPSCTDTAEVSLEPTVPLGRSIYFDNIQLFEVWIKIKSLSPSTS